MGLCGFLGARRGVRLGRTSLIARSRRRRKRQAQSLARPGVARIARKSIHVARMMTVDLCTRKIAQTQQESGFPPTKARDPPNVNANNSASFPFARYEA